MKQLWKINELPILASADVVVAGGGTAGAVAAISAAREGAETLVVERYGCLGGSAVMAQVVPMMSLKIPSHPEPSSISLLIKQQMTQGGWAATDSSGADGWFNPVMLPFVLDRLLSAYGGKALFDATIVDVLQDQQVVAGLVVQTRSGLGLIKAGCVIDATGDALVAEMAGVPCQIGREDNGRNQNVSLRFTLGGIDLLRLQSFLHGLGQTSGLEYPLVEMASIWDRPDLYPLESVFRRGLADGLITYDDGRYFQAFTIPGMPGVMAFNCPEIPGMQEALSATAVSQAYITGRQMTGRLAGFLRQMVPGFENSWILSSAPMIGIRESRRIEGVYLLSADDYLVRRKFSDGIAQTAYPIDIHGDSGLHYEDQAIPPGDYFEIPFRCLVPYKADRLLVAGRCISATFSAQSAIRIQPICRATGEAAGIAAAWLTCGQTAAEDLRLLDGSAVRRRMIEWGGVFAGS
ncbi:MAG: FAD-dependent oxidoreductase [Clostridiaceae bacterium]|nr:FAD-dependent oxidoreductase [Clostridiaceae bacterium]